MILDERTWSVEERRPPKTSYHFHHLERSTQTNHMAWRHYLCTQRMGDPDKWEKAEDRSPN